MKNHLDSPDPTTTSETEASSLSGVGSVADRKTAHTPGPWHVFGASVYAHSQSCVATCGGKYRGVGEKEANAARIVACVNRLEGIPTDEFPSIAIVHAGDDVAGLRAQRDELVAALEVTRKHAACWCDECRAALAKLDGGK